MTLIQDAEGSKKILSIIIYVYFIIKIYSLGLPLHRNNHLFNNLKIMCYGI